MQRKHNQEQTLLEADFEQMVDRHDALIRKVCFFYASDFDDFNDLRQEALVNLWRGFPKYRGEAKISNYRNDPRPAVYFSRSSRAMEANSHMLIAFSRSFVA
jgi:RNA polymerase sigma-70 factor (ECF subfamily)